jgi:hypothetical protein
MGSTDQAGWTQNGTVFEGVPSHLGAVERSDLELKALLESKAKQPVAATVLPKHELRKHEFDSEDIKAIFENVLPIIDKNHSGKISYSAIDRAEESGQLNSKEMLVLEALKSDGTRIFDLSIGIDDVNKLYKLAQNVHGQGVFEWAKPVVSDADRDRIHKIDSQLQTGSDLIKAVDWLRAEEEKLHPDRANESVNRQDLDDLTAAASKLGFNAHDRKALNFFKDHFDAMAKVTNLSFFFPEFGIPTAKAKLATLMADAKDESSYVRRYTDNFTPLPLRMGAALGAGIGSVTRVGEMVGAVGGTIAGGVAGEAIGNFNYYVLKKQPYSAFVTDMHEVAAD